MDELIPPRQHDTTCMDAMQAATHTNRQEQQTGPTFRLVFAAKLPRRAVCCASSVCRATRLKPTNFSPNA